MKYRVLLRLLLLIIITYHDFLPHQGGVVMSSQITHTIINIHPLVHILNICALIFSSCALFTVYPTPLQWWDAEEHRAKQKWQRETHSVTYVPGLSTLSDLAQLPSSFLCYPRTPSLHSSRLTSVSLVSPPPLTSAINTLLAMRC